jgi:PleD family two-component response regulator
MQSREPKRILAVVGDLFFSVKLADAAKRAGLALEFARDAADAMEKARGKPALIILDLNFDAVQPLDLIAKLKASEETRGIGVIAYVSHVQGELKRQAHAAGCDMVLARSAFSQSIPQIFKRHAGT